MNRLRDIALQFTQALWFVPALVTLVFVAAAFGLVFGDRWLDGQLELESWEPLLFGAGPDSARAILGTIAGALITAAGVTFSGVLVTLSIASSQYTSRVLRFFTANRLHQVTLGLILGGFVYALIVMKMVGAGSEDFVPELATLAAVPVGLVGVSALVLFVHSVSRSIQAAEILGSICHDTCASAARQFTEPGDDDEPGADTQAGLSRSGDALPDADAPWQTVHAKSSGYVRTVDIESMVEAAEHHNAVIRMELMIGDYALAGSLIGTYFLAGDDDEAASKRVERVVREAHVVGTFRTAEQDPAFGILQMVDIGLRALSPGINDTTTAVMAVHRITTVLHLVMGRDAPRELYFTESGLRLIRRSHDIVSLVRLGYEQIASCAQGNVVATRELVRAWIMLAREERARERCDVAKLLAGSARTLMRSRPERDLEIGSWAEIEEDVERLCALAGASDESP